MGEGVPVNQSLASLIKSILSKNVFRGNNMDSRPLKTGSD